MKPRANIYVDGFNMYYGLVKDGPYKWLNLEKYFSMIRQHDGILKINCFTALISGPHLGNQSSYLRALRTIPAVEIILGKFMKKNIKCKVPCCDYTGSRIFETAEEKGTDVNIAVRIIDDAYNDRCDNFVLVSGDSDLVPALAMIRNLFPAKKIIVYVPAKASSRIARHSKSLSDIAHRYSFLPEVLLGKAQFPGQLRDTEGVFSKPDDWK